MALIVKEAGKADIEVKILSIKHDNITKLTSLIYQEKTGVPSRVQLNIIDIATTIISGDIFAFGYSHLLSLPKYKNAVLLP